jgi:cell division protein FtsI/penicillin-binding protein 2
LLDGNPEAASIAKIIEQERARPRPRGARVIRARLEDRRLIERLDVVRTTSAAQAQGLYGLLVDDHETRSLPNGDYARDVIGTPPGDGRRGTGMELALDAVLRGDEVETAVRRDGKRHLLASERVDRSAVMGKDVRLSIDVVVQHVLETELDLLVERCSPSQATGIVLDPRNGEILALASRPRGWIDLATTGLYEPGSVFKPFTVSQALALGVVAPDEILDMPEQLAMGGLPPVHDTHYVGPGDVVRLLAESSNTGAMTLAWRMGGGGLERLFERMGFGKPTGVELPGEARGGIGADGWKPWRVSRAGFGQGFTITPLHLASTFAAFARDDGRIVRPTLLPGAGGPRPDLPPLCARPDHLAAIRLGLEACVDHGTGAATIAGGRYAIAGKTGTAQIPPTNDLICSFAGYAPREAPRVLVLVMARVTKQERPHPSGGSVAGPTVRSVVDRTLGYLDVPEAP